MAVCFMNSYVNDTHERRTRDILIDEDPWRHGVDVK